MAVADLVGEWFEHERLRAAVAADGIFGTRFGPWSAGSGLVLLLRAANEALGAAEYAVAARRPGRHRARARAGASATGRRRDPHGRSRSTRVIVDDEQARGVVLGGRHGDSRPRGDLRRRSEAHVSAALRSDRPAAGVPVAHAQLSHRRHAREDQSGAVGAAVVHRTRSPEALAGRIRICPDIDYLERAFDHSKYGRYSPEPYIELTIPTVVDPSLAPNGAHVLSAYVQFAPYRLRDTDWDRERDGFARTAARHHRAPRARACRRSSCSSR